MIDKKTVFVLGAGASCPYGYPHAKQLRSDICIELPIKFQPPRDPVRRGRDLFTGQTKEKMEHFAKTFLDSTTPSIDLFLARNPRLAEIGKYIIAHEIFYAEQTSNFNELSKEPSQDWYSYLFHRLTQGIITESDLKKINLNNITFITFNYDRSLEYFLSTSFMNSFTNVPENKILDIVKNIHIHHVYGKIAPLNWENGNEGLSYRTKVNELILNQYSKNIRTIYEEEKNPELENIELDLQEAEQVFFLGFGYDDENMNIIKVPEVFSIETMIYGTGFGLNVKEISDIKSKIMKKLERNRDLSSRDRVYIKNMDCLELLRNYL
jgi:hypothetical protein